MGGGVGDLFKAVFPGFPGGNNNSANGDATGDFDSALTQAANPTGAPAIGTPIQGGPGGNKYTGGANISGTISNNNGMIADLGNLDKSNEELSNARNQFTVNEGRRKDIQTLITDATAQNSANLQAATQNIG